MGGVAESEQRGRAAAERVAPDHQRRDPDPATDEHRPAAVARRREPAAQRPEQPDVVAGLQRGEPLRPRPDVLEHEVERPVRVAARDRERARQERPLVGAATPALGRGQHRELPGIGSRPVRVGDGEQHVGAVPAASGHAQPPAAERRQAHGATPAPAALARWISCRESTVGEPWRAAAIARAAAIPPDIVVMHGMPRAIAARRIS